MVDPKRAAKAHENSLRRLADANGYRLEKSRQRLPGLTRNTWQLVDARTGELVAGDPHTGYGLTLVEVELFLTGGRS